MERDELERQAVEVYERTISAVNEILTPLEDDPEKYLSVINKLSDNMVRAATREVSQPTQQPDDPTPPVLETVEITIENFEKEYAANPIKARRKYTGKLVNVTTTMDEFEKYLANGATPSTTSSSEKKYMYKNVSMIIPGEVVYMDEKYKDGANYEVGFKGGSGSQTWELVSLFPKEAGKQIENISRGQTVKVKGHYDGRNEKENRYFLRDCELIGVSKESSAKSGTSAWVWGLILAAGAAAYYFLTR